MRFTDIFNNREIATGIWIVIVLIAGLLNKKIRQAMLSVIKAFFKLKILSWLFLMVIYTAFVISALHAISFWNFSLLKDSIIWLCFSGITMCINYVTSDKREELFKTIFIEHIKVIAIIEFLINTYTFSLFAELLIIPFITFIAMLNVVSESNDKYAIVARLTTGLQTIIGLTILAIAAVKAFSNYRKFLSYGSFKALFLPFILSILFFPFMYVMLLITTYELIFLRFKIGCEKDRDLIRYAKRRILRYLKFNLKKTRSFLKGKSFDLIKLQSKADVDEMFI